MLVCGHCFCQQCTASLTNSHNNSHNDSFCICENCTKNDKKNHLNKKVRCPLCREVSSGDEKYLVQAGRNAVDKNYNIPCTSKSISESVKLESAANNIKNEEFEFEFDEFDNIPIKVCYKKNLIVNHINCIF